MMNLVLIGFMATGKSTLGTACAARLGMRFVDSDEEIVAACGRPIARVFAEDGEQAFRELEARVIADLASGENMAIATGGGVVLNPANAAALRRTGFVLLLRAQPETILARVGNRASRPLLADAEDPHARIVEMLAARAPYYEQAAHAALDTDELTEAATVESIVKAYQRFVLARDSAPAGAEEPIPL